MSTLTRVGCVALVVGILGIAGIALAGTVHPPSGAPKDTLDKSEKAQAKARAAEQKREQEHAAHRARAVGRDELKTMHHDADAEFDDVEHDLDRDELENDAVDDLD